MNDLIKGAVRQKNITNKNQMPEWMKREQERAAQKKVGADINSVEKTEQISAAYFLSNYSDSV